jgi:hypothetical protein
VTHAGKTTAGPESGARMVRSAALGVACFGLIAAAIGCGGGNDSSSVTTTSAPQTGRSANGETTLPEDADDEYESVEDEIIARYRAFWEARFEANMPPDPDDPALREYATGAQLEHVIAETQANQDEGVEFRRPDDPADFQRVRVVSVEGDHAVVQECVVSDGLVVRRESGEIVDDSVVTYSVRGEMERIDSEWRLAAATAVQRWEGIAGCALAD